MKRKTTSRNGAKAPRKADDSSLAEEVQALRERVEKLETEREGAIVKALDRIEVTLDRMLLDAQTERINAKSREPAAVRPGNHYFGPYPIRELMPLFLETQGYVADAERWDALPPEKRVRTIKTGKNKGDPKHITCGACCACCQ